MTSPRRTAETLVDPCGETAVAFPGGTRADGDRAAFTPKTEDVMKGYVLKRYHIDLDMGDLDDDDRDALLAGIQQTAPQSALYAGNTAIQASYTALVKKAAALKTARDLVSADEQKLAADKGAGNVARSAFDTELLTLAALTSYNATSTVDLSSIGFTLRGPAAPMSSSFVVDQIDF